MATNPLDQSSTDPAYQSYLSGRQGLNNMSYNDWTTWNANYNNQDPGYQSYLKSMQGGTNPDGSVSPALTVMPMTYGNWKQYGQASPIAPAAPNNIAVETPIGNTIQQVQQSSQPTTSPIAPVAPQIDPGFMMQPNPPQIDPGQLNTPITPLTPSGTVGGGLSSLLTQQPNLSPNSSPNLTPNPLSQMTPPTPTTGFTTPPDLGTSAGSSASGSFTQGSVLPNVTTTQEAATAAPSFYTDFLNQLATQGASTAQNAQYVGASPLQQQAFSQAQQNVGNYQPTLQNAINLASNVGSTNLAQAIGDLGQSNIANYLAPQATAGLVGSGQFGSSRGAQALGSTIANAELGITQQQQQALQQDQANKLAAAGQLGSLAGQQQTLGLGDVNALSTLGGQQQTIAQNEQLFPMQQLTNESALLRGYTVPTSVSTSTTAPGQQGQFAMSPLQQIMGLGSLATGLFSTDKSGNSPASNIATAIGNIIPSASTLQKLFGGSNTQTPTISTNSSGTLVDSNGNPIADTTVTGYTTDSLGNTYLNGNPTTVPDGYTVDTSTGELVQSS